ncbi:hypothetical protein ACROYT_G012235 [Oculina patagonica]
MERTHQAPRVIIYPRNPTYRVQQWGGECCAKCLLIFFTVMFLLIGFILTMVGHLAKPFWGPEDDGCDFCREERLSTERNLKNCRIVGPIFLAIGGVLFCASIFYCHVRRKNNQGQVLSQATTAQMGTTSQAGTGTATSMHYPANTFGYQQPYGQSPAYQPGSYPNNPPPPAAGSYSPYPTGQVYPPAQPPYPSQGAQGYQPYPTDMPPPPSYESTVDQSTPSPSAPPVEKVG